MFWGTFLFAGNVVEEKSAIRCKVTYMISRAETLIFFNELGQNINQKVDGYVGVELMLCERVKTSHTK